MEYNNKHIEEPGIDLLLAYLNEIVSDAERRRVEEWADRNEENRKLLMQLAGIYYARRTRERILARDPIRAFRKVRKRWKRRRNKHILMRCTAVAACLVSGVLAASVYWTGRQPAGLVQKQRVTVRSNPGIRTSLHLPDGTQVYLNSGSTLSYPLPYDRDKREVSLAGEAYFKVKHNPSVPFVVSVAHDRLQVEAVGTEFNLQAFTGEGQIETTLVTGRVNLRVKGENGSVSEQKLYPSEKATFHFRDNQLLVENVDTRDVAGWRDGRLVFKDCPLSKVLKDLSYFYNAAFQIEDPVIETYNFTGTFRDKQLFQVLDYLKIACKVNYIITSVEDPDSTGTNQTVVVLKSIV